MEQDRQTYEAQMLHLAQRQTSALETMRTIGWMFVALALLLVLVVVVQFNR